jgi:hypothetical protein
VVRLVIAVLFWVGLFLTVREWRHARKHRLTISRREKLYLALIFPVILGVQLILDLIGIRGITPMSVLAVGAALNGWAIKRRVQRVSSKVAIDHARHRGEV